jgi:hypothetical protein
MSGGGPGIDAVFQGQLYTTVVRTTAELVDALENDRGDTFIAAGYYIIDTDTVGPMDTTPRHFIGAGRQLQSTGPFSGPGVIIEFTGLGTSITSLDFSGGLTESEGVEWSDVSMFSSTASLTSFFTGLYGAKQINLNGGSVTIFGFSDSYNLVNCSVVNMAAPGIGFFGCTNLTNCTAGSSTLGELVTIGFFICENLANCWWIAEAGASGADVPFLSCDRLANCFVDASAVTSATTLNAFDDCEDLVNCQALGPAIGALGINSRGFDACTSLQNCKAQRFDLNYTLCTNLGNCESVQGVAAATGSHYTSSTNLNNCRMTGFGDAAATNGFDSCVNLSSCDASGATGNGFNLCNQLAACLSLSSTLEGFRDCITVAGCEATTSGTNGFGRCANIAGAQSDGAGGNGFNGCFRISGADADGNTGFGYAGINTGVSNCTGAGNTAGLSDLTNLVVDPITAAGI